MTDAPMRIDLDGALVPLSVEDIKQRQADADIAANTQQPANTRLNFLAFMELFTADEQASIVNSADPRVRLFCLMAAGAQYVDLTDPRVIQGTKLLEALKLIAASRADQVLGGKSALPA